MENNDTPDTAFDSQVVRNMVESAIRIALLFGLFFFSYDIIKPFTVPLLWGGIIAMAAFPLVRWLEEKVGIKRGWGATLVSLAFILALVVPTFGLTSSLIASTKSLTQALEAGTLNVPPPPEKVADWPVVGEQVYTAWEESHENLEVALRNAGPQIRQFSGRIMKSVGSGLAGVAMFVVSLIIGGAFMAYADRCADIAQRIFARIGGVKPGGEWADLCVATVRSVLQGVVGVAVIQAALCAIGLFAMGVPGAPIWASVILFFAIAQLPAIIIILPIIIWAFSTQGAVAASVFAVYMLLAGLSDNILKPILMGRGLDIPMPVILIGAIGGMLASGIIGLFAGAVVLSIWYKLFGAWMEQQSN